MISGSRALARFGVTLGTFAMMSAACASPAPPKTGTCSHDFEAKKYAHHEEWARAPGSSGAVHRSRVRQPETRV